MLNNLISNLTFYGKKLLKSKTSSLFFMFLGFFTASKVFK